MRYEAHRETAVYLGEGVWREISEREARSGMFDHLPRRIRPVQQDAFWPVAMRRAEIHIA